MSKLEFDKNGRWKCEIVERDINACQALERSVDHYGFSKAKGLYRSNLVNMDTMEFSRSEIGVRSKSIPNGIMFNFCPFCGEKINVLLETTHPTGGSDD